MGYNPYRKANGEFATKEEAGAQVESDYATALASGDTERITEMKGMSWTTWTPVLSGRKFLKKL